AVDDPLAVHLELQAQHAMGRGVLGPEVQLHLLLAVEEGVGEAVVEGLGEGGGHGVTSQPPWPLDLTPGPSPKGEGRKTALLKPLSFRRGVGVRSRGQERGVIAPSPPSPASSPCRCLPPDLRPPRSTRGRSPSRCRGPRPESPCAAGSR